MPTVKPPPNECKLCIKKRVEDGLEPLKLTVLPVRTRNLKLPVRVCPSCDGNILDYALRNI